MDLLQIQSKLIPDVMEIMQKRYTILRHVSLMQPIGRRSLAQSLGLTERVLRAEVDFLKQQGLLDVESIGMKLSDEGYKVLQQVSPYIKRIFGLNDLEKELEQLLDIPKAIVVNGDSDDDDIAKREIGKATVSLMLQLVQENDIVALTGGSTVAEVASMMPEHSPLKSVMFVPARGGIGENHEFLANTIASQMAKKTGGKYSLLHVPDLLSEATYASLINEENIKESLEVIRSANIVIHGIGEARTMARRRKVSAKVTELLENEQAIGEAFGYYFNRAGEIVYKMNTIGLRLDDLSNINNIIAVAGGKSKADAILSVLKHNFKQTLVTDEGAAIAIINKIKNNL